MKKTWLNSKEPAPGWMGWLILVALFLAISAIVAETKDDILPVFIGMSLFLFLCTAWVHFKNKKIIDKVGKEIYEKVNADLMLIRFMEKKILLISKGRTYHLMPTNNNYTGKIKEFWDKKEKDIRYEVNYKEGQEHGSRLGWHINGQLAYKKEYRRCGYLKMGKEHGKTQIWDKSGKLLASLEYSEGKIIYK